MQICMPTQNLDTYYLDYALIFIWYLFCPILKT